MNIKIIDLFAGVGGFRLAFESIGASCVMSSEIDKHAIKTYNANFKTTNNVGDISTIDPAIVPVHDVLCAGFSCQPFSVAGKKLGFEDTRGTLFFDIARIAKHCQPKVLLLENVKGLISHNNGETIFTIFKVLNDIGYKTNIPPSLIESADIKAIQGLARKMVLRSSDFGVPQRRERIFIVAWRKDIDLDYFEYPKPQNTQTKLKDILEKHPDPKYTLSEKIWQYHQERKQKNKELGKGFGYSLFTEEDVAATITARYGKDGNECFIYQENKPPRKLTPRECARLQGFPETYVFGSDTQTYKQMGNAVTVNTVRAVAERISDVFFKGQMGS